MAGYPKPHCVSIIVVTIIFIRGVAAMEFIHSNMSSISSNHMPVKAMDDDLYTYAQTEDGENQTWSVTLDRVYPLSCFTMTIRGGFYNVYIKNSNSSEDKLCTKMSLKGPADKRTHSFCCSNEIQGDKVTVMRNERGTLRLYEFRCTGCEPGTYGDNRQNCTNCSETCTSCDSVSGICYSCHASRFGDYCEENCPLGCYTCDKITGACSSCKSGYYGQYCTSCPRGKFGKNCSESCPAKCNSCDRQTGECNICSSGHYTPYCEKCSDAIRNCVLCNNQTICIECSSGWFGNNCLQKCADNCSKCHNISFCLKCQQGLYGQVCNYTCPEDCDTCTNNSFCDSCKGIRSGTLCECFGQCKTTCSDNGNCLHSCKDGFYGKKCTFKCRANCEKCDFLSGKCIKCAHNYSGDMCSGASPTHSHTKLIIFVCGSILVGLASVVACSLIKKSRGCPCSTHQNYGVIEINEMVEGRLAEPYEELETTQYINLRSKPVCIDQFIYDVNRKKQNNTFRQEFKRLPNGLMDLHFDALNPKNRPKNRYKQIYPYDFCRVVLDTSDMAGSTDYINASFVQGFDKENAYIAAQGPFTRDTVIDFWRMIWQTNCTKIVMLTNLQEGDQMKCLKYWPNEEVDAVLGPYTVNRVRQDVYRNYDIRHFKVLRNDEQKRITHFHFKAWPTATVPDNVDSMLSFRNLVKCGHGASDGPIIVHCSAGIGRTGTFIALDYLLEETISKGNIDVISYISRLRQQRAFAVQSTDEYIFLHDALVEGLANIPRNHSFETSEPV